MSGWKRAAWRASRLVAHGCGPLSRGLYRAAKLYARSYDNLNYDMATNGEHRLLDRLAATGVRTVLDVGANKGEYTLACLGRFEAATIHAFEIAPPTFAKLRRNVASDRVRLNDFGLSDAEGSFVLNYNPHDDGSSSLIEGRSIHDGEWERIEVKVVMGDDYCERNGLETIDLLKIDVEGAEHLVLDGFSRSLASGRIAAVQFEFGMVNIYSKFLLKDFYELFDRHGYALGPIMPDGVDVRPYDVRHEDFQGPPNFFAVHRSKPQVIKAVRR